MTIKSFFLFSSASSKTKYWLYQSLVLQSVSFMILFFCFFYVQLILKTFLIFFRQTKLTYNAKLDRFFKHSNVIQLFAESGLLKLHNRIQKLIGKRFQSKAKIGDFSYKFQIIFHAFRFLQISYLCCTIIVLRNRGHVL